jgi:hypothetical protein
MTYGYRWSQFESFFSTSRADAVKRVNTVLEDTNSLYSGDVTVKGNTYWRVGYRYQVNVKTSMAATTNRVWYVRSVSHSGTWGEDWTTSLELAYPTDNEQSVSGNPNAANEASAGASNIG